MQMPMQMRCVLLTTTLLFSTVAHGWPLQSALEQLKAPQPQQTVQADPSGDRLGYRILGNPRAERTVVMVPGSLFNHRQWDIATNQLLRELGGTHRIIQFDYPGIGLSASLPIPPRSEKRHSPLSGKMSTALLHPMAEQIARLLDHLKVKKAHLFGYSLGSSIALGVAALRPDLVASVFNYGTTYPSPEWAAHFERSYGPNAKEFGRSFGGLDEDTRIDRSNSKELLRVMFGIRKQRIDPLAWGQLRLLDGLTRRLIAGTRVSAVGEVYYRFEQRKFFEAERVELDACIKRVRSAGIPVWLSAGAKDGLATVQMSEAIAKRLGPRAQTLRIHGAQHHSLAAPGRGVGRIVGAFIKTLPR